MPETCFVIMPFGMKKDPEGNEIDFDLVYRDLIQEPIERSGLEPLRCDEIEKAGIIHDDMFEQIARAKVAVVDITNLNANVFYELGARHALRNAVTVLIRRRGAAIPFNIQDLRVIEYPSENNSMRESRDKIQRFIESGLESGRNDSPIRRALDALPADDRSLAIDEQRSYAYLLKSQPAKAIEIRTGDITKWRHGADVWVNSENANMQMARFYDRNLSAAIRYHGAKKDENGEVVEDTIALELEEATRGRGSVTLGSVYTTSAGALTETHRVKTIFHVAAVTGVPSRGYRAEPSIVDACVERCLQRVDSPALAGLGLKTIAFPMMGTGAGGGDVRKVARILIDTAVAHLEAHAQSRIERVIFMAWNGNDLDACLAALAGSSKVMPAGS